MRALLALSFILAVAICAPTAIKCIKDADGYKFDLSTMHKTEDETWHARSGDILYIFNHCGKVQFSLISQPCAGKQPAQAIKLEGANCHKLSDPDLKYEHRKLLTFAGKQKKEHYGINITYCGGEQTSYGYPSCFHTLIACGKAYDPQATRVDASKGLYTAHMTHPAGCYVAAPSGLGFGWIMIILLLVAIILYFAVGIPVQKFVRHKEGLEIIPLLGFWKTVIGLVKDGLLFVFCCGRKTGYQSLPV